MAMHTTTNIHGVKAIRVLPKIFRDFVSNEITFELEDGGTVTVSGFAGKVLPIEAAPEYHAETAAADNEIPAREEFADEGQPF